MCCIPEGCQRVVCSRFLRGTYHPGCIGRLAHVVESTHPYDWNISPWLASLRDARVEHRQPVVFGRSDSLDHRLHAFMPPTWNARCNLTRVVSGRSVSLDHRVKVVRKGFGDEASLVTGPECSPLRLRSPDLEIFL